jgi:hypothetical protein
LTNLKSALGAKFRLEQREIFKRIDIGEDAISPLH